MRPKYIIGVVIGIFLIYLSLYGTAGLGFSFSLTGNLYKTDFNNSTGWASYSGAVFQNGELYCGPTAVEKGANTATSGISFAGLETSDWTIEIKVKKDDSVSIFVLKFWLGSYYTSVAVTSTYMGGNDGTVWYVNTDNNWHTYTVQFKMSSGSPHMLTLFQDTTQVGTFKDTYLQTPGSEQLTLDAYGSSTVHFDYVYMDSGLISPTPGGNTYTLTISANTGGSTNPSVGDHSYSAGTTASVQATANSGYTFSYWMFDGANVGNANPYIVTMNAAHTLQAVFTPSGGSIQLTISVNDASKGYTSPSGSPTESQNAQVPVTAYPNSGCTLDHWMLDGNNVGTQNPYTVNMGTSSHTLVAVFAGGGGVVFPDIFKLIRDFLNNPTLRQLELAIGAIMTAVCSIVFVIPKKKAVGAT